MTLTYLPEYAQQVRTSEALARKEAELLSSADAFIATQRLRNALVHEYMQDAEIFLESLLSARQACELLFDVIDKVSSELQRLGVPPA